MSQATKDTQKTFDIDALQPIPFKYRTMSPMDYAMVFWSSGIIVQIMVIGLYLLPPAGNLNFIQVIAVGLLSAIIVATFIAINGDMGIRHGIPFVMQGRSGFGINGARFVAIIRSIPAIAWNGIGTWIGALSLEVVTKQLFGVSNVWVYFFLILSLQTYLSYRGLQSIKWFNSAMSIIIFCMLGYFFYIVLSSGKIDFAKAASFEGSWSFSFIAGVMAAVANWTTVILNSSDLARHIKVGEGGSGIMSRNLFANLFGVIPPWMFMVLSGMLVGLATGANDPIAGLASLSPNPVFGVVLMIFIILAQVTSNLTLNILPPAMAMQDIFGINWKKGVVVVAILSVATAPWLLFTSNYFFKFQNFYSCFLGPALGVLIADYYIIRKRKVNVALVYKNGGVYNYVGGFSPAGMTALVAGAVLAFIFLDYSWFVGFPFALVLYTVLKKCGIERKYEAEERALGSCI